MIAHAPLYRRGAPLPRLRELRTFRLLTQDALAREAGICRATLARIERTGFPAELRTIRKLAAALGVEADELMRGPGE